MMQIVSPNNKGMTLIEVLIATFLFLVISLALLQTSVISVDQNMRSTMRDEAVGIAENRMVEARKLAYTDTVDELLSDSTSLSGVGCPSGFPSTGVAVYRYLGEQKVLFCTNRTTTFVSTAIGADVKEIAIRVDWKWRGERHTHNMISLMRKQ